jgi:exonuclease SbcC
MINGLKLHNFRTYKDIDLSFSAGVNMIVGESDQGKSNITRALQLLFKNTPSGSSYVTKGERDCSVSCNIDDNIIERKREKDKNIYVINDETFTAMRTNIPDQIVEASNISDINFQTQFDPHFLLSESAGAVARKLNKIANIEKIDVIIKSVNALCLDNRRKITDATEKSDSITQQLEEFKYLAELEAELNRLIELDKHITELNNSCSYIQESLNQLNQNTDKIDKANRLISLDEPLTLINNLKAQNNKLTEEAKQLKGAIDQLNQNNTKITIADKLISLDKSLKDLYSIESVRSELYKELDGLKSGLYRLDRLKNAITGHSKLLELEGYVSTINSKENASVALKSEIKAIKDLVESFNVYQTKYKKAQEKQDAYQQQWDEQRGSICPICGNTI